MDYNLFVKRILIDKDKINDYGKYPFNIEAIKNFNKIEFTSPVTFLVGENGIGKSTFIEAIAVSLGLNSEGGTQNFNFSTKNTHSNLSDYMRVLTYDKPKTNFFLRAENFYNVASEIVRLSEECGQELYMGLMVEICMNVLMGNRL